jgi:Ner family transcriptional regulator
MRHQNWHPADIIAALKNMDKPALVVEGLAFPHPHWQTRLPDHGPKVNCLSRALDIPPDVIWPERYFDKGRANISSDEEYQKRNLSSHDRFLPSPQRGPERVSALHIPTS